MKTIIGGQKRGMVLWFYFCWENRGSSTIFFLILFQPSLVRFVPIHKKATCHYYRGVFWYTRRTASLLQHCLDLILNGTLNVKKFSTNVLTNNLDTVPLGRVSILIPCRLRLALAYKTGGGRTQLGQIEATPFVWVTVKVLICMQAYRTPGSTGLTLSYTLIYVLISPYVLLSSFLPASPLLKHSPPLFTVCYCF